MVEVERANSELPLILNPKEFLAKPFERLKVGLLANPPDTELLKWLPALKDETGLILIGSKWCIIKASGRGIPSWIMPNYSDVMIHSHIHATGDRAMDGTEPSLGDFVNCSPTSKNLIVSHFGITQYWHIADEEKMRIFRRELLSHSTKFVGREGLPEYKRFLETNDARYKLFSWKKISEQGLEKFLRP